MSLNSTDLFTSFRRYTCGFIDDILKTSTRAYCMPKLDPSIQQYYPICRLWCDETHENVKTHP